MASRSVPPSPRRKGASKSLRQPRRGGPLGKSRGNSDQQYHALMENANDAICIVGEDSRILEANPAAEALHGRPAAEIVGRSFLDFLAPEERDRIRQRFSQMLIRGSDHDSVILLRGSGERIRADVSASRVEIGGQLVTLAILRDASERERAAEALEASERRYRELFENASIGIYRSTRGGRFVHLNLAFAKKLGYASVEEVLPLDIARDIYWDPSERDKLFAENDRVGGATSFELRLRKKDGTPLWVRLDSRILRDEKGTLSCEGFVQDVTERKNAEEELRRSRERLQMLSRRLIEAQEVERRRLARELHDEIGQALTAVKINLQAARQPCDEAELAGRVSESIEIVERTMNQVRDISLALRPSLLDDLGLVPALRWCVDSQAQRAGFTATFLAEPVTILLAPQLEIACYRVVQEALTNVAKHAGARSARVEIAAANGQLTLRVRDDGAGFDVVAARERAAGGSSLGLLTMTERVRLLGGRLEIDSAPGRGTEIRARLPLRSRTT